MDGIFISYRRDDSAGYAGRLYDRLVAHFGAERVFMDVEGIEPGLDFVVAIEEAVASCRVLIAVIGDEWTTSTDAAGRRRLDDPNDFIRLETGAALQRGIRVVPVLVGGAVMPLAKDLPDELKALTRRQAVEINHKQWEASTGELIHTLENLLKITPSEGPDKSGEAADGKAAGEGRAPGGAAAEAQERHDDLARRWLWPAVVGVVLLTVLGAWIGLGQWKVPVDAPSGKGVELPKVAPAPQPSLASGEKAFRQPSAEEKPSIPPAVEPAGGAPAAAKPLPGNGKKAVRKAPPGAPGLAEASRPAEVPAVVAAPAATPAALPGRSKLPVKGEKWVYRSSGKWPTSPKRRFEIAVQAVTEGVVTDELRVIEPEGGAAEVRRTPGGRPDFIAWTTIGPEFGPYLGAFVDLAQQGALSGFPTPDFDPQWTQWYSKAEVIGQESVSVPAGSFAAIKLEVWSSRRRTGSLAQAQIEPVRVHYLIWYAPQIKRYVRMQRSIISADNSEGERDVFELLAHRAP